MQLRQFMACDILKAKNFNRICLRILEENIASKSLALKLGFKIEGMAYRAFRDGHGQLRDVQEFYLA